MSFTTLKLLSNNNGELGRIRICTKKFEIDPRILKKIWIAVKYSNIHDFGIYLYV